MTLAVEDLATIHLDKGSHTTPEQGHCFIEAASMFAKEPFSDHPACVSPYLRSFGITLNDRATDERRQDLVQFIQLVVGTAGDGLDEKRRYLAADHVARVVCPKWLDRAGLTGEAEALRSLTPITDLDTWRESRPAVRAARDAAYQLRQERRDAIKAAVRKALADKPVVDAVAVADADAVADAIADAVAVADAVDVAVAVAIVDADAGNRWSTVYNAVYRKMRAIYEERYADVTAEAWADAIALYRRLIEVSA